MAACHAPQVKLAKHVLDTMRVPAEPRGQALHAFLMLRRQLMHFANTFLDYALNEVSIQWMVSARI